jgi:outer membrane protein TolC
MTCPARTLVALVAGTFATLGGCTTYKAAPLTDPEVESILESPDRAQLTEDAANLHHPLLPPIKLDFTQPLTGEEIEVIAVLANPDLRALRAQQGVADAQVFSSGLLPDPQVSLGFDKVLSPKGEGLTSAYAGSLSLDLLGALAAMPSEKQAAKAAAAQVRDDIAWQEWTSAGQARLLEVRLAYQMRARNLTHLASEQADRALDRALHAAAVHDLAGDEIEVRRIAAADARDRSVTADRDVNGTRLDLNHALGLKPEETPSLADPAPLTEWHALPAGELFNQARKQRLDLNALAQGYAGQEATYHRAILGQYPRLGITINRARDTSNVHTLGPAVSLDLPLWNRNRGAIAVARADRTRLRAEFAARLHQTRSDIAALVDSLDRDEHARVELAAQVADLERLANAFESAATHRDVTEPTAEAARSAAIDKRIALLSLEQSCAEQRIALALATGTPISRYLESP